eukprot:Clim_evm72s201 gene=Clim_evmTU72s201
MNKSDVCGPFNEDPSPRIAVVVDTNVLLNALSYVQLLESRGNTIGIPIAVLRELDGLKNSSLTAVATSSRSASRWLEDTHRQRPDALLWEGGEMDTLPTDAKGGSNDELILRFAERLHRQYARCDKNTGNERDPSVKVRRGIALYTEDRNLRLRAVAAGVPTFDSGTVLSGVHQYLDQIKSGGGTTSFDTDMIVVTSPLKEGGATGSDVSLTEVFSILLTQLEHTLSDYVVESMKTEFGDQWKAVSAVKTDPFSWFGILDMLQAHWQTVFDDILPRSTKHVVNTLKRQDVRMIFSRLHPTESDMLTMVGYLGDLLKPMKGRSEAMAGRLNDARHAVGEMALALRGKQYDLQKITGVDSHQTTDQGSKALASSSDASGTRNSTVLAECLRYFHQDLSLRQSVVQNPDESPAVMMEVLRGFVAVANNAEGLDAPTRLAVAHDALTVITTLHSALSRGDLHQFASLIAEFFTYTQLVILDSSTTQQLQSSQNVPILPASQFRSTIEAQVIVARDAGALAAVESELSALASQVQSILANGGL